MTLVQPLLVSRLLFALPLSAAWMQQRLSARDWLGAAATAGGLATFIAVGRPTAGPETAAPLWRWALASAVIGAITLALVFLARRRSLAGEAPLLGAGAGMLFGLQSGLTHSAVSGFLHSGIVVLLTSWTTYTVAATAVLGTLLAQSAYELAPLASSYPVLAAVEPLTGIGIGVLGGSISLGALPLTLELLGLATMTTGIVLLATSPLVTGQLPAMRRREIEELASRIEDQARHRLAVLEKELAGVRVAATVPAPDAKRLADELDEVDQQLTRLATLRTEPAIQARSGEPAEHRQAMDRWQRQTDQREKSLRGETAALHARIDAIAPGS